MNQNHAILLTFLQFREIRAESGAWFYQSPEHNAEVKKKKKKKAYGSFLMKKVFSKGKKFTNN